MSATAVLVEVDVTAPDNSTVTLRFSDRVVSPFPPTDATKPNVAWDDRMIEAPTLRRALFDDLSSLTPALGVGVMTLANADGALDAYQAYTWGQIRVWRWTEGAAFSGAIQVFAGLCGLPGFGTQQRRVSVPLYDYSAELDTALQATTYAGTNAGSVGYEGEPSGLKGRVKPLAFGSLLYAHVPAPNVNSAIEAHQLHDGPIDGVLTIFEAGNPAGLVFDGNLASAAFNAATPAAGHYVTDNSRALVRINYHPIGTLTFGFQGFNGPAYAETPGPVAAQILVRAGVPGARIGASIAALFSQAVVGVWVNDTTSTRDVLALFAIAAGAAILPDRAGVWQGVPFGPPAAVASHVIAQDEVLDCQPDETAPAPVGEVKVAWGRLYNPFDPAQLSTFIRGTVFEEQLTADWKWVSSIDAVAKARYPRTARTVELQSACRFEGAAQFIADSLRDMFGLRPDGRPRLMWTVTVELTDARLAVQLGATVRLVYPPRGIDGLFVLIAEQPFRPRRDQAVWTVWG